MRASVREDGGDEDSAAGEALSMPADPALGRCSTEGASSQHFSTENLGVQLSSTSFNYWWLSKKMSLNTCKSNKNNPTHLRADLTCNHQFAPSALDH